MAYAKPGLVVVVLRFAGDPAGPGGKDLLAPISCVPERPCKRAAIGQRAPGGLKGKTGGSFRQGGCFPGFALPDPWHRSFVSQRVGECPLSPALIVGTGAITGGPERAVFGSSRLDSLLLVYTLLGLHLEWPLDQAWP